MLSEIVPSSGAPASWASPGVATRAPRAKKLPVRMRRCIGAGASYARARSPKSTCFRTPRIRSRSEAEQRPEPNPAERGRLVHEGREDGSQDHDEQEPRQDQSLQ